MQRMMDEFFRGWWTSPWAGEIASAPALDVREMETEVVVEAEVPGLKPDELDLSISDGTLSIKGERKSERDEKEGDYHLTERSFGSFSRVVALPAAVDADKAAAKYENGVVTITLPKTEQAKPKKVEVKGK
jgi:HSP20 family protein